jgi:hypothetical protein
LPQSSRGRGFYRSLEENGMFFSVIWNILCNFVYRAVLENKQLLSLLYVKIS